MQRPLSRRKVLTALSTLALGTLAAACSTATPTPAPQKPAAAAPTATAAPKPAAAAPATASTPTAAPKPAAAAATPTAAAQVAQPAVPALSYKPAPVAGGKNVTLQAWDWHQPRIEVWKGWFSEYQKVQKNVGIEILQVPSSDYLKKLQAAIPAGQAPDMFYFHNQWHSQIVDGGLLDPLPKELFPRGVLNAHFAGMKEGYFHGAKDKEPYYMVAGVMHGGIYYNKKMWADAGLTEKDEPKTWDQLVEVAKKLTKKDASGRISVAGFAFNQSIGAQFGYLRYQTGEFSYTKDGKKVKYDTPGMRKALQWFVDAYDVHKINDRDFPEARQAFATEKAAMTFQWSWVTGWLQANHKNLEWGIFASPTWTGKNEPAVGPNNFDPLSFVVPKTTPDEKKQVAWDFIYWMYGDPERVIDHALIAPSAPAMKGLQEHPKVLKNPTLKALSPQTEYTIFAFGGPPNLGKVWTKYFEDGIFKAGMSISEAVKKAEEEGNQYMAEGEWVAPSRERAYIHADKMDQSY